MKRSTATCPCASVGVMLMVGVGWMVSFPVSGAKIGSESVSIAGSVA